MTISHWEVENSPNNVKDKHWHEAKQSKAMNINKTITRENDEVSSLLSQSANKLEKHVFTLRDLVKLFKVSE